jgi:hypothetical protein
MAVASTSFMTLNNCDFGASPNFETSSISQNLGQINEPIGARIKSD